MKATDSVPGNSIKAQNEQSLDGPKKTKRRKMMNKPTHVGTQEERCISCFENPKRPKHLTMSIGTFNYLMLPQWQPVVPGHRCISTIHHESATRSRCLPLLD